MASGRRPSESPDRIEPVAAHAADLARRLAVDLIVDAGANEGQWASQVRRSGYTGEMLSFEPVSRPFEALARHASADPRWRIERRALGASEGVLALHATPVSLFGSALAPSRFARGLFPQATAAPCLERVRVSRLDEVLPALVDDLGIRRILLKLDTQGYDLEVFAGAARVLERVVALQAELSVLPLYEGMPTWIESLESFAAEGFSPTGFFPVVRTEPYATLCEMDCVLSRHGRIRPLRHDPQAPPISVIITACGDSPAFRKALTLVREQARPLGAEVVAAINAEPAALAPAARQALEALCDRMVFEPRTGKSHALNSAIATCRSAVVAFTDDDGEPQPGWLEALTAPLLAADREPELVGCGGPVVPILPKEGVSDWYREFIRRKRSHFLGPRHEPGDSEVDYTLDEDANTGIPFGANCAYRREVFGAYHYDPELGPNRRTGLRGGEDYLLGMLLLRDGYRLCYRPEARVEHPVDPSRATPRYVLEGYARQGTEWIRMQRALGETFEKELPKRRRRLRRIRRKQLGAWLAFWDRRRNHKRVWLRCKTAFQRAAIQEIRRLGVRPAAD